MHASFGFFPKPVAGPHGVGTRLLSGFATLACSFALSACGAGVVLGGLFGGRGGGSGAPPARPPTLVMANAEAPLVSAEPAPTPRILFVNDFVVPSGATIELELRALGAVSPQGSPVLVSVERNTSQIAFLERHDEILARLGLGRATEADVAAELVLRVDGVEIGKPLPFLLRRRPTARLSGKTPVTLSALGGSRLALRVRGLLATDASELELQLATRNRSSAEPALVVTKAADVRLSEVPGSDEKIVSGVAPPADFPGRVFAAVVDPRAGLSTGVAEIYYEPAVIGATPRFLPADGGVLVTLIGQGLAPLDLSASPPYPPAFDAVRIDFVKGGRVLTVDPTHLRRNVSSLSRLVFTVPPSPDGRSGPAEVAVTVDLGGARPRVVASGVFVYRYRNPVFGPRGAVLAAPPRSVALADLKEPGRGVPDAVMVHSVGRVPRVQLLASLGNGVFATLGRSLEAGRAHDPAQRDPADVCPADTDGDGRTDLVVLNRGAVAGASHSIVFSEAPPKPPLRLFDGGLPDVFGGRRCTAADVDGDGKRDLVVLPDEQAARPAPRLFLSRPRGPGKPWFEARAVGGVLASSAPYQVLEVADLDGDGSVDLAAAAGGTGMRLVVAYGDGKGAFPAQFEIPLSIAGYQARAASRAIGLHACGDSRRRSLALVLSGEKDRADTPPVVAVVRPASQGRGYVVDPQAVVLLQGRQPIAASAAGDLDHDGIVELVTVSSEDAVPVRLFVWDRGKFLERPGAVDPSLESMENVSRLAIDVAVPADGKRFLQPVMGVFVTHQAVLGSAREDRISVYLVDRTRGGVGLVAPDASLQIASRILGLALGNFTGSDKDASGRADDVLAASPGLLYVLRNDGVGGYVPERFLEVSSVVPASLSAAPLQIAGVNGDSAAFLETTGRLAILLPGSSRPLRSPRDLRTYAPAHLRGRPLAARSRLRTADVDGDGVPDMVVLLAFEGATGEGEAVLLLLRGRAGAKAGEFPLHLPSGVAQAELTHGNAADLVLGDFARESRGPRRLEVAVAVPFDATHSERGNHVRFYHHVPGTSAPEDDRFALSFADPARPVLVAGDRPAQLGVSDFDGDGDADLAVASGGDSKVRVLLNNGRVLPGREGRVNVAAFQETFASPPALPPGEPTGMFLGDLDGDGVEDVIVAVLDRPAPGAPFDYVVAYYLSSGTGNLSSARIVPDVRTGNRIAAGGRTILRDAEMHPALGDVNRDGRPDLVIGWRSSKGLRNLRILFGGVR